MKRELPLHFHALAADPAMPMSDRVVELVHADLQRWTRRHVRPVARLVSRVAVWTIVAVKRLLPFQFSSHDALDRLSVWFLRRCVSPEGTELLLRHFLVETALLRFVARNAGLPAAAEPDLMPTRIEDLMGHAVIRHDEAMYRLIITLGRSLRATGRYRCERRASPDFAMLELPAIDPGAGRRLVALDLGTALYFMNIPFAFFTTEDVYEQAVNSFQLDEPLMAHLADITGDDLFRSWGAPRSLSWLEIPGDVPRALYRHAVVHEQAHTHLCRMAEGSRRAHAEDREGTA